MLMEPMSGEGREENKAESFCQFSWPWTAWLDSLFEGKRKHMHGILGEGKNRTWALHLVLAHGKQCHDHFTQGEITGQRHRDSVQTKMKTLTYLSAFPSPQLPPCATLLLSSEIAGKPLA